MNKLSEKIGYGLGDMSSSMFWKIFSYYLPIFYSDIFGLKPQHAAILLLVTKLYDAISDPMMGLIADRTHTRWGKYRPYLLWIAVPFAIIGLLSFYTPNAGYTFKHIYAYTTYLLMMTAYTAINVPYGAMLGVVSADSNEKSVYSSFRMFFAYVGSFIAMGIFAIFERKVGGNVSLATPMQWTGIVAIISGLCAVIFLLCFALTREHVASNNTDTKSSVLSDLKALATNKPWWILLGGSIGLLLFGSLRGGAAAYYFANILNTDVVITCAIYLIIGEIAQMAGVVLAVPISNRVGKKSTFITMLIIMAVLSAAIWFVHNIWTLVVLQLLICVAIGVVSPLLWSMFADVADASQATNGKASVGLIFSSSSMAQKFGGAFGAFLLMQVLAISHYDSTLTTQSAETLTAIRALMSWIPAIGALVAVAIMCLYPLTTNKMKSIQQQLNNQ